MQTVDLQKWQKTVNLLARLYGAAAASIVELRGEAFEVVSTSGDGSNALDKACSAFPVDVNSYCRRIMDTGEMLYVGNGAQDQYWKDSPPVTRAGVISYLGFPIWRSDDTFFGTICVKHDEGTDYPQIFLEALHQFRDLVQSELALVDRANRLEQMLLLDSETGCSNRRGLRQFFDNLKVNEQDRWGLIYIDLDNLKATNDTRGHQYGDIAINLIGNVLLDNTRDGDVAARIGGDEFVLVAQVPDQIALDKLHQRVVHQFDQASQAIHELDMIGVSAGVLLLEGSFPNIDIDSVLRQADAAMYADKHRRKLTRSASGFQGQRE